MIGENSEVTVLRLKCQQSPRVVRWRLIEQEVDQREEKVQTEDNQQNCGKLKNEEVEKEPKED